jgi:hypothetical protein
MGSCATATSFGEPRHIGGEKGQQPSLVRGVLLIDSRWQASVIRGVLHMLQQRLLIWRSGARLQAYLIIAGAEHFPIHHVSDVLLGDDARFHFEC